MKYSVTGEIAKNSLLVKDIAIQYIYLITRVSMQYRELLHEWAWYFHEPKASEIIAICMVTSVIKCLLSIPE